MKENAKKTFSDKLKRIVNYLYKNRREDRIEALEKRIIELEKSKNSYDIGQIIKYAISSHWNAIDYFENNIELDAPRECPMCEHRAKGEAAFTEVVGQCQFMGGRLVRHECPNCGLIFGPQKMLALDPELLELEYRLLYQVYAEGDSSPAIIRSFRLLEPRKDGIYLDYGCGGEWSKALSILRQEGWNILGFDPHVNKRTDTVLNSVDDLKDKRFDGIITNNVLEHFQDPIAENLFLNSILNKDGAVIHTTPCFDYRYEFTHYHLFFFTGRSAEFLARRSNMRIDRWVRDSANPDYIACIMKSRT